MPSILRSIVEIMFRVHPARVVGLTAAYAAVLTSSILIAYQLRFDFNVPAWVDPTILEVCAIAVGVHLLCLFAFHQYDGLLSYFSAPDFQRIVMACVSAAAVLGMAREVFGFTLTPPRGVLLMNLLLSAGGLTALRMSFRRIRLIVQTGSGRMRPQGNRVGIVGAGDCGAALASELLRKPWLALQPVAFFDDHRKANCGIHGIPMVGRPEQIEEFKTKLNLKEVIIAMPSAPAKRIRDVLKITHDAGLPCRTVPSLDQLATGHVSVSSIRPVRIHDLLGREPVRIEDEAVQEEIAGRTIMVTGAGGSIGSELCRQILSFKPSAIVLVERSEPQLFAIEQELRVAHRDAAILAVVGDITRRSRMREIFHRFRPHVVFHAAAHKHVPMMESQPDEAVRNNVFGTVLLADLAIEHAVERFIFVSTDKAVNPTNVMGATKRLAEMYVQSLITRNVGTKFMAVRFGNVLGSSGSVVPAFERQIAAGGPVTVTHPEVTRFFMTIPEAVSLVLQSSALGRGGDIFILDMGKPVKIVDLALQMIALSGLTPHQDIDIQFIGMRPGEKLYEELSHGGESVTPTSHAKVARLVSTPLHYSFVSACLAELEEALEDGESDAAEIKRTLARILPEYTPFLPDGTREGRPVEASERSNPFEAGPADCLPENNSVTASAPKISRS